MDNPNFNLSKLTQKSIWISAVVTKRNVFFHLLQVEDESDDGSEDDHTFVDIPSTSADDQPGPSGVGKDGDAPWVLFFNYQLKKLSYLNV